MYFAKVFTIMSAKSDPAFRPNWWQKCRSGCSFWLLLSQVKTNTTSGPLQPVTSPSDLTPARQTAQLNVQQ